MTSADVLLVLVLAGAFLIGFFWGVLRGLLGLGAWLVVFLLSAHLSDPVGDYLQHQWRNFSPDYVHTLSFLICFALLFTGAVVLIQIGVRGSQDLTRYALLDDLVGGLLGTGLAVLAIAAVIAILNTFYATATLGGAQWSKDLDAALTHSTIGGQIASRLVPAVGSLLDPLLPASLRGRLRLD